MKWRKKTECFILERINLFFLGNFMRKNNKLRVYLNKNLIRLIQWWKNGKKLGNNVHIKKQR